MRDEQKIRPKHSVQLENRQIAYLVFGAFIVAAVVFAAGFLTGQRYAGPREVAVAHLAGLDVLGDGGSVHSLTAGSTPTMPELGFEQRLSEPIAPEVADDPALRLLAQDRNDLATPGTSPETAEAEVLDAPPPPVERLPEEETEVGEEASAGDETAQPGAADGDSKPPPARTEPTPPKNPRFTLQIQAFRQSSEADAFARMVDDSTWRPYVERIDLGHKGTWYRVRIGLFETQREARTFQKKFERREGIETFITSIRKRG
jgi:cell division septation protein DedD